MCTDLVNELVPSLSQERDSVENHATLQFVEQLVYENYNIQSVDLAFIYKSIRAIAFTGSIPTHSEDKPRRMALSTTLNII